MTYPVDGCFACSNDVRQIAIWNGPIFACDRIHQPFKGRVIPDWVYVFPTSHLEWFFVGDRLSDPSNELRPAFKPPFQLYNRNMKLSVPSQKKVERDDGS